MGHGPVGWVELQSSDRGWVSYREEDPGLVCRCAHWGGRGWWRLVLCRRTLPLKPKSSSQVLVTERSRGARTCTTAFWLHVTSGKPLWGPRVVLGPPSKSELLENRWRPSGDSRDRKQRDPLDFGPPVPLHGRGSCSFLCFPLNLQQGLHEA